jgi:flavin reductase (DIM6/NTAB) family NADH-FMN oxidoreductase RutF
MSTNSPDYLHFDPGEISIPKFHHLMLGAIAPRPIALASTIDREGRPNLSPFSFFNAFGANPPIVVFSPSRRGKDSTTKHTYENIREVPEVVINAVTYEMVQKVSDSSADFPKEINEFEAVGLTMQPSDLVKPFRVKESPVQFECKVLQVIETGQGPAAGNLVICEILRIHVNPAMMDEKGRIDPHKMDLVGRLGGEFYVRASGAALFELAKPE